MYRPETNPHFTSQLQHEGQPTHPSSSGPPSFPLVSPPQHPQPSGPFMPQPQPTGTLQTHPLDPQMPQRMPAPRPTKPVTWFVAACCAIFWIVVILGGLIVLIVYLVFRPRSPRFDLSSVTLNAAYLDMGYLLNADVTVLANFTNPNKKVRVDFSYMTLDLYYGHTLIASQYLEPFSASQTKSQFANVHMVVSQVRLPFGESQQLKKQIESNGVKFQIKGVFRARSNLGSFLRYSYWLYAHCGIVVTAPPDGVLRARKCITKR